MTGVDVTTALADLLRHPDADLRIQAALALGTQAHPEAAEALLAALDDPDANVRFHAIDALGKIAPAAAVERLAAIAESGDFFLAFPALDALARINDASVAPRIVPLLRDELVGDQAAEALGHIGDEEAVAPLVAALDRPDASPASIVDALAAIHRRYGERFGGGAQIEDVVRRSVSAAAAQRLIDAAARASGPSLKNFVVVLGWLRGAAVEGALTHMLGTPAVQHELVEAIVRFGAPMVDVLVEQLGRDDLDTRRAAVAALGHIGDTRAGAGLDRAARRGRPRAPRAGRGRAGAARRRACVRAARPSARRRRARRPPWRDRRAQFDRPSRHGGAHAGRSSATPIRSSASRRSRSPAISATPPAPTGCSNDAGTRWSRCARPRSSTWRFSTTTASCRC
jgi:HEAT repeat protein